MKELKHPFSLYFIMGSRDTGGRNPVEVLRQAIEGGITCFQFREKGSDLTPRETVELGRQLRAVCREHGIPFIVNDRVDLALILDADGVHIGQEDLPVPDVRRIIGSRLLGVSTETVEEARRAVAEGADYLGVGPMFATSTKPDAGDPIGPSAITRIRREIGAEIPLVGIGGVTPERAPEVLAAGADGVAVISAISRAASPVEAARLFRMQMAGSIN
jgi:thiamine-phosphate pyrophosphorylase